MSPELETLDRLLGGDIRLAVVRSFFREERHFLHAIKAMLETQEVRLLDHDSAEVPEWRWHEVLIDHAAFENAQFRLAITGAGIRRIG